MEGQMPLIEFDDPSIQEDVWRIGGDFLRDQSVFPKWTWWVTLTFQRAVSAEHAETSFRLWAKRLARDLVGEHVRVAWALERAPRSHVHALLAMPPEAELTRRALESTWKSDPTAGFTDIVRYDSDRGAAFYLAKKDGWRYDVACPRHRRCRRPKGCLVARASW
jgi:hypothetical protein